MADPTLQRPPGPPPRAGVAVIGGGLAGLAAAVTLARAGLDVQALEAGERVGGRVLTIREPFADGLFAEGGGEFIAAGHTVLRDFARQYGLTVPPRQFGPRTFSFAGQRSQGWSLDDYGGRIARDGRRIAEASLALSERVPDPERAWAAPDAAALDAHSLADWLDDLRLDPIARAHQDTWTVIDYGVEPESLSLLMYARDERMIALAPDEPVRCIRGGTDQLPRAMAAELGPRIHLASPVTAVDQSTDGVTLAYRRPDGSAGAIEAARAVVAVPFTVLRSLTISPPLDPPRCQVIDSLRYGHVLKTLLQFRRRFWRQQGVGGYHTDLPIKAGYDATHDQPGRRGILTVYTAGRAAAELAGLPDEQRLARVLEQLETLYPGCRANLERSVSVVWDADPFARGAYSHFGPGELTRFAPLLARPLGRLHFAGEHTDPWQATMNGALASGLRAANEILDGRSLPS